MFGARNMRRGRFSFFTKPGEKEVMGEVVFFLYDVLPWERGDGKSSHFIVLILYMNACLYS